MRQYIIASHAHFATGIKESIELLSGARDNVHDLSMFVDDRMDVAEEADVREMLDRGVEVEIRPLADDPKVDCASVL